MERRELSCLLFKDTQGLSAPPQREAWLALADPEAFKASFAARLGTPGPLLLGDSTWGEVERTRVAALLRSTTSDSHERGWLWIPTGGSSGRLRFARHDQETLRASVEGFCAHFGMERVNAVGVLPLHHVSGLMAWMRCVFTGGRHLAWSWRALEEGRLPPLDDSDWVISLVPTQLQRLLSLSGGAAWLRRFRSVFLGGAPAWPLLLKAAREAGVPLSLSYGMTETAAMVCALQPQDFLAGAEGAGRVMPHARLRIDEDRLVRVSGGSLFRGYAGEPAFTGEFQTEDLARIEERHGLVIEGRRDAVIITGGEKVAPAEVEEALRGAGWSHDLAVVGVPDPEWGSLVTVCLSQAPGPGELQSLEGALRLTLARYKLPKRWVLVDPWPRSPQGKINRAQLAELAVRCPAIQP